MATHPQIRTALDRATYRRVKQWAERHLVPNARIVKRLLQLIPWWKEDETQFVFSVDKRLIKKPDDLRAALHEAADLAFDALTKKN